MEGELVPSGFVTAEDINEEHQQARSSAETAINHAVRCGELLQAKKKELAHGEFRPWIEGNCDFAYSTAARYMKAAKQKSTGVEISSLRGLFVSGQPQPDHSALPLIDPPTGQYRCIVIDPPWEMQKIARDVRPNQVGFDYPTMTLEQIAAFPLPAADDCILFLWTTQKYLPAAFTILEGWGFAYLATMVWHKPGGFQPVKLPQYNCEFALIARRGKAPFIDTRDFKLCQQWPRREHSRKPDGFYDLVRRVTAGPRIDIFSREQRPGFDQHGNEPAKFVA